MPKKNEDAIGVWLSVGEDARANPAAARFVAHVLRAYLHGSLRAAPGFDAGAPPVSQAVAEAAADLCQTLAAALDVQDTHAAPKKPARAPASAESKAAARELAEVRTLMRLRKLAKARR